MSWTQLENAEPNLAAYGRRRFETGVAYLATVRRYGAPRVHPVTPIIAQGMLFLFMEPTSPKGFDLRYNGRYALHAAVGDANGTDGEFLVAGKAFCTTDPFKRSLAAQFAAYTPADRYILFELEIYSAASTIYEEGQPIRQRWKSVVQR